MIFLSGDIIVVHSSSILGGPIRWATRFRGEPPTYGNHIAQFVTPERVIEAHWTVREGRYGELITSPHQVWRHKELVNEQRRALAREARRYLGRAYGPLKLFLHLGDALLSKVAGKDVFAFRRMASMQRYPICSWLVAWAYLRALDYQFGMPPEYASPDDMHDYMRAHPEEWVMIKEVL